MANVIINETHLEDIADAIRGKNGTEDSYKPREMAAAIDAITAGSEDCNGMHIPEEALVVSGNCPYRFSYDGLNWFIEQCGDKIAAQGISNAENMFYSSQNLVEIPFDINIDGNANVNNVFWSCYKLENVPYIKGKTGNISNLFYGCQRLRSIPEDWGDYIDTSYVASTTYGQMQQVFASCYSLRKAPVSLLSKLSSYANTTNARASYKGMFQNCYCLDEAVGIPINTGAFTSNSFADMFASCFRLNSVLFETQGDGSPYSVNWKSQTIDLSTAGFVNTYYQRIYVINYNSGITVDKQVYDDATYAALKDDADWFACDKSSATADTGQAVKYSRYNKTSAVNTINSLPDVSSGSGNTIKFKGEAGSATDGGAINTLTEEEIAVAAAKGWTVTFV